MPRDLEDVLHYLLPDAGPPAPETPLLAVPLLGRDLVRCALLWNLAVEAARQGARVSLVVPEGRGTAPWPEAGRGPLGVEVIEVPGEGPAELARAAEAAAGTSAPRALRLVLVGVPAPWLAKGADAAALLRWVVCLARPDERESDESLALLRAVLEQAPRAQLGATVFGVRSLLEARRSFEGLAARVERELERPLASYGVLIDDVQLSRSIVARRPVALAQPTSSAARALADVASLCLADARLAQGASLDT
jgi:hypothetical protein